MEAREIAIPYPFTFSFPLAFMSYLIVSEKRKPKKKGKRYRGERDR